VLRRQGKTLVSVLPWQLKLLRLVGFLCLLLRLLL
jgi:hypothetical protein